MFHVALYQPRIPPNTGNIIRLSTPGMEEVGPRREQRPSANTGARLHLIEPLGFRLEDRELRRAGLDYHEWAEVQTHPSLAVFLDRVHPHRLLAFSTHARRRYTEMEYRAGDALLFGSETQGLPTEVLEDVPADRRLRLPLRPGNRSLNLANAVAVVVYEAWRQLGFAGGE